MLISVFFRLTYFGLSGKIGIKQSENLTKLAKKQNTRIQNQILYARLKMEKIQNLE